MKAFLIITLFFQITNIMGQEQVFSISLVDTLYYNYEIVKTLEKESDTLYSIKHNYIKKGRWLLFRDMNKQEIILESNFSNDTCNVKHYYPNNGGISFLESFDGAGKILRYAAWYSNGQLGFDLNYQIDTMPVLHYYSNGAKKLEAQIVGAYYVGEYKEWYEEGALKLKGEYYYNKIGIWQYYSPEGRLIKEEKYRDGELIETIDY
jgi:antitoxin component YwqK of YwqJK toxin-antitoxin module